ncbi:MAG: galactose-phosphate uridylyltransferase [Clostridia bacterium]|jgi:UDPglucose--hexose-1-phosphate uridylyltransferase|nr:galactose-phosphate uridylyltransferase [Clostridia bacterium]
MVDINREIRRLVDYGIEKKLICKEDEVYVINSLLEILQLDEFIDVETSREELSHPQFILDNILEFAHQTGILEENTVTYRDLLDTKLMGCFVNRPSEVLVRFFNDYKVSAKLATDNYYKMSMASNYIRKERTDRNLSWKTNTEYGELDITINLSKPEKDPKAIAAARNLKFSSYPKCLLCSENEGYAGRVNHPARQNLRVIPIELCKEKWFLQFSPYVYYNEHSIIFKGKHEPMKIGEATFDRLLEFVYKFPHYFIGSNADLPIVGGSILSHDHFQGGSYNFAMESAPIKKRIVIRGYEEVEAGIVKWPMSVIRLRSIDISMLSRLSNHILEVWKNYSDESVDIISHTDSEPHNTVTPIARFKNNKYEMDIVLRNNRTSEEHPLGIFHPHSDLHHIKKENIGLIEVMGLAVLPARLIEELNTLKECLIGKENIEKYEELQPFVNWYNYIKDKYMGLPVDYQEVLRQETGKVFERILSDAGVFKQDSRGLNAFEDFINKI